MLESPQNEACILGRALQQEVEAMLRILSSKVVEFQLDGLRCVDVLSTKSDIRRACSARYGPCLDQQTALIVQVRNKLGARRGTHRNKSMTVPFEREGEDVRRASVDPIPPSLPPSPSTVKTTPHLHGARPPAAPTLA